VKFCTKSSFCLTTSSTVSFNAVLGDSILNEGFLVCNVSTPSLNHLTFLFKSSNVLVLPLVDLKTPCILSSIFFCNSSTVCFHNLFCAALISLSHTIQVSAHTVAHSAVASPSVITSHLSHNQAHIAALFKTLYVLGALIARSSIFSAVATILSTAQGNLAANLACPQGIKKLPTSAQNQPALVNQVSPPVESSNIFCLASSALVLN
jgi:hypothetical protein